MNAALANMRRLRRVESSFSRGVGNTTNATLVISVADPDPHGSAFKKSTWIQIRIQEVKKPRKVHEVNTELRKIKSKYSFVILTLCFVY